MVRSIEILHDLTSGALVRYIKNQISTGVRLRLLRISRWSQRIFKSCVHSHTMYGFCKIALIGHGSVALKNFAMRM